MQQHHNIDNTASSNILSGCWWRSLISEVEHLLYLGDSWGTWLPLCPKSTCLVHAFLREKNIFKLQELSAWNHEPLIEKMIDASCYEKKLSVPWLRGHFCSALSLPEIMMSYLQRFYECRNSGKELRKVLFFVQEWIPYIEELKCKLITFFSSAISIKNQQYTGLYIHGYSYQRVGAVRVFRLWIVDAIRPHEWQYFLQSLDWIEVVSDVACKFPTFSNWDFFL